MSEEVLTWRAYGDVNAIRRKSRVAFVGFSDVPTGFAVRAVD